MEPHLSAETLELHYEKHHKGYLRKLQNEIDGKPEAERGSGGSGAHVGRRRLQQRRADLEPLSSLEEHEAGRRRGC
ncbi:MAG: hypothetical protein R3E53_21925 [Myxococcota bacterium]